MKKPPCKDCEKREPGCHGKCEKYKAFQKKWEEEKRWLRKENEYVVTSDTRYRFSVTAKAWFIPKRQRKRRPAE